MRTLFITFITLVTCCFADNKANTLEKPNTNEEGLEKVYPKLKGKNLIKRYEEDTQSLQKQINALQNDTITITNVEWLNPQLIDGLKNIKVETLKIGARNEKKKVKYIPTTIGSLRDLQILIINSYALKELPKTIANLTNLKEFSCKNCQLTEFPDLKNAKEISTITLSENKIKKLPDWLLQLPNLQSLRLSGNPVVDVRDPVYMELKAKNKIIDE